jgi:hypothetical protein
VCRAKVVFSFVDFVWKINMTENNGNSTEQPPSPPGTSNQALTLSLAAKYKLPDFNPQNPELWFAASEVIFASNGVQSEQAKFAAMLQYLDSARLTNIQGIISNPADLTPYTNAKKILTNVYAESKEKKLNRLLGGAIAEQRPSLMLQEIQRISVSVGVGDTELVKQLWLQRLPPTTQAILVPHKDLDVAVLAPLADSIQGIQGTPTPPPNTNQPAQTVNAAQATTCEVTLEKLCSIVTALTNEVCALKLHVNQRDNEFSRHSRTRSPNRSSTYRQSSLSRHRTPTRSGTPFRPFVKNEVCTYHYKYGKRARRCMEGCKYYETNSENENRVR